MVTRTVHVVLVCLQPLLLDLAHKQMELPGTHLVLCHLMGTQRDAMEVDEIYIFKLSSLNMYKHRDLRVFFSGDYEFLTAMYGLSGASGKTIKFSNLQSH